MARRDEVNSTESTTDVLKDMLIVNLGLAGVRKHDIRNIVGCDMNRVTRIVKHLKIARIGPDKKEK